ncbi:MAG: hypothetical protein ACREFF_03750 [Candidatus Udaeobacter sp.]
MIPLIFLVLCTKSVLVAADDLPLKKVKPLTYVVDYEPFWSPDSRHIVLFPAATVE